MYQMTTFSAADNFASIHDLICIDLMVKAEARAESFILIRAKQPQPQGLFPSGVAG